MSDGLAFGLVRGRTPVFSAGVKDWTHDVHSHVNMIFANGVVYEAEAGGFDRFESLSVNNSGCQVDVLEYMEPLTAEEGARALAQCEAMRGRRYDWRDILAFVNVLNLPLPEEDPHAVMCSESAMLVSIAMGSRRILQARIVPSKVSPRDVFISPLLRWTRTIVVP